jgi:tRNA 5-methylaminomethyl-2-thiouridine biosynthesis bifunctional protein
MKISPANVTFNPTGTPVSEDFDDVYFRDGKGLAETDYVFIKHNYLLEKWSSHQESHFVIAETGFGTGLNFLRTWQIFKRFLEENPNATCQHLYFISTEKFPIPLAELQQAIKCYPELTEEAHAFYEQYPLPLFGCHRLNFPNVTCDIWIGDINDTLPLIYAPKHGLVDTWYLDGFAPSKNPEMWQPELFANITRISKQGASLATFTAASFVRRNLQDAGFIIKKVPGFGQKREMITATFAPADSLSTDYSNSNLDINTHHFRQTTPYFNREQISSYQKIHIVGGGIAAATLAYECTQLGLNVEVYCKDTVLAQGASGNAVGGFYPQLNADPGVNSQIQAHSFLYAKRCYQKLAQTQKFGHAWCGVLLVGFNEKVQARHNNLIAKQQWPESLLYPIDAVEAGTKANIETPYPGLFIPDGGWVSPPELVHAFFSAANATGLCNIHYAINAVICAKSVELMLNDTPLNLNEGEALVFATGHETPELLGTLSPEFRLVRGQVEILPPHDKSVDLSTVICHKGYFTPVVNGAHACGSTYSKNDITTEYRAADSETNLMTHKKALAKAAWMQDFSNSQKARAAIRCSTPDHNPMCGKLADLARQRTSLNTLYKAKPVAQYPEGEWHKDWFVLSGLGSRGLTTAPLLAATLAAELAGRPLPLSMPMLNALMPNRFLVREMIRQQPKRA